jgi:hypothetical protein
MVAKKKQKEWDEKWSTITDQDIIDTAHSSVHYSFKYVNSNLQGGVLLSNDMHFTIPYVFGCTIDTNILAVDYINPAYKTSSGMRCDTMFSYINYLKHNTPNHPHCVLFVTILQKIQQTGVVKQDKINNENARLRQVLLPFDNTYISATPLPLACMPEIINEYVVEHNSKVTSQYISTTFIPLGGSKPHNVGYIAGKKQTRALVMSAPTENPHIREAMRVFYKGISINPNYKLLYNLYNDQQLNAHNSINTQHQVLTKHLLLIIKEIIQRGDQAYNTINTHLDVLDITSVYINNTVKGYDNIIGVINPTYRTNDWILSFTDFLVTKLTTQKIKYKINDQYEDVLLTLDSRTVSNIIIRLLKENIKCNM